MLYLSSDTLRLVSRIKVEFLIDMMNESQTPRPDLQLTVRDVDDLCIGSNVTEVGATNRHTTFKD